MTSKTSSGKTGLGAALAATIADEKKSNDDRFAKAERLLKLSAAPPAELSEKPPVRQPEPAILRPTRAPQDHRANGGGESLPAAVPVAHEKVIRDTFTFPPADHQRIKGFIKESLQAAIQINKSEVIRAGLLALQGLSPDQRFALLESVEKMKPGRPVE